MTDHDPIDDAFDRELAVRLRSADLPAPDANAALDGLRPRYRRARRRRTAATGAAASLAAVAVLVAGGFALADDGTDELDVVDGPRPSVTERPSTTSPAPTTTAPPTTATTTSTTTPAGDDPAGGTGGTGVTGGTAAATTVAPAVTTPPVIAAPTTAAPVPVRRAVDATGGTVVVDWTPTSVELVSVASAPGWREQSRRDEADRVEVRFERDSGSSGQGSGTSRVEVRVVDGQLSVVTD